MATPPKDYEFAFTIDDLFCVVDALNDRRRTVEIQLGQAYIDGNTAQQSKLHGIQRRLLDLSDMLAVPTRFVIEDWWAEEATVAQWEHDTAEADVDEWDLPDDFKDPLYSN